MSLKTFLAFLTVSCLFQIGAGLATTVCTQHILGETYFIECPDINNETQYCCMNNGLLHCCSYDDYEARTNGPSYGTIVAIIVSQTLCFVVLALFCCYRCAWCPLYKYKKKQEDVCIEKSSTNIVATDIPITVTIDDDCRKTTTIQSIPKV